LIDYLIFFVSGALPGRNNFKRYVPPGNPFTWMYNVSGAFAACWLKIFYPAWLYNSTETCPSGYFIDCF